jgi:2-iminobutanoate/2-iminopropanoate deaminase
MNRIVPALLATLFATSAQAAEYMQKTPFQLSRAFSPGVVTSGGMTVWVAGQTATEDGEGRNIANNFEAQVKQVMAQVDGVLKRAGGGLDNVVAMTVFIKESRYGDKFVEMRKDFFKNGNYPGSALITVTYLPSCTKRISPFTRSGTTTIRPFLFGNAQKSAGPLKSVASFLMPIVLFHWNSDPVIQSVARMSPLLIR